MDLSWLPNWKDSAAYPNSLPLAEWPWQFLRRNPKYQSMWTEIVAPFWNEEESSFDSFAAMEEERRRVEAQSRGADYHVQNPIKKFDEEFGLFMPVVPPPRWDKCTLSFKQYFVRIRYPGIKPGRLEDDEVAIAFNLSWPIQPQIDRVKKVLEGRQDYLVKSNKISVIERRNHETKYSTYLRLLDAKSAGATQAEMATTVFPNAATFENARKSVKDGLKSAKRMRDSGYQFIIS